MNGYEALAYLTKDTNNKVYRKTWCDGTKWVQLIEEGRIVGSQGFGFGEVKTCCIIPGFESDWKDDAWEIYKELLTPGQAIDAVIEGKGKVYAHCLDAKGKEWTVTYDDDGHVEPSFNWFDAKMQEKIWELKETVSE